MPQQHHMLTATEKFPMDIAWECVRLLPDCVFGDCHEYRWRRLKDMVKALVVLRCLCCPMRTRPHRCLDLGVGAEPGATGKDVRSDIVRAFDEPLKRCFR